MKNAKIIFATMVLFLSSPLFIKVQANNCEIGSGLPFQRWVLVDSRCQDQDRRSVGIRELEGKIIKIEFNADKDISVNVNVTDDETLISTDDDIVVSAKVKDGDTQIFIKPYPNYTWMGRNRNNETNSAIDSENVPSGTIESEIKTITEHIDTFFPAGTHVHMKGWWVEDKAHSAANYSVPADLPASVDDFVPDFMSDVVPDVGNITGGGKTEIHPIISMVGEYWPKLQQLPHSIGNGKLFSVFIGQDWSERFNVSNKEVREVIYISVDPIASIVRPDLGETGNIVHAGILREKSMLDVLATTNPYSRSSRYAYLRHFPSRVQLITKLDSPNIHNNVLPFYLGRFERMSIPLFKDEVKYSVQSVSEELPNTKKVVLDIGAEIIDSSPEINFVRSFWKYEKQIPINTEDNFKIENDNGDTHRIDFQRIYSPAIGFSKTSWNLSVAASDKADDSLPNTYSENNGMSDTHYLFKQRFYEITPSELKIRVDSSLDKEKVIEKPEGELSAIGSLTCSYLTSIYAEDRLLPDIRYQAGTFKWYARDVIDGNGNYIFGGSIDAELGSISMEYRVPYIEDQDLPIYGLPRIRWTEITATTPFSNEWLTMQRDSVDDHKINIELDSIAYLIKKPLAELKVEGTTELGEKLEDRYLISPGCVPGNSIKEFFDNYGKAYAAAQDMKDRGMLDRILDIFRGRDRYTEFRYFGEPYKTIPRLTGDTKLAMEAFYKLIGGKPVSVKELVKLKKFSDKGKKIKWKNPPPKAYFDSLRVGSNLRQLRRSQIDTKNPPSLPAAYKLDDKKSYRQPTMNRKE